MRSRLFVFTLLGVSLTAVAPNLVAQSTRKPRTRTRPTSTRAIDVRAAKLEQEFVREAIDLADEYNAAGHSEKSKKLLEAVLKLDREADGVRDRITELDKKLLTANEQMFEVDASASWQNPGLQVTKGRPVQIRAAGSYRLMINSELGPTGFENKDARDLIPGVKTGALIAVVYPEKGKPGRPIVIGQGLKFDPKESGLLLFRVNVPPNDAKCVGKFKVSVSGYVSTK